MNKNCIRKVLTLLGVASSYSTYASEEWDTFASHINTDVPPSELSQEVNQALHQTFDQATQKKK